MHMDTIGTKENRDTKIPMTCTKKPDGDMHKEHK